MAVHSTDSMGAISVDKSPILKEFVVSSRKGTHAQYLIYTLLHIL